MAPDHRLGAGDAVVEAERDEGTEQLMADPATYSRFQFSVLQILPRSTTPEAVIAVEGLYKHKLLTKRFGLNAN